MHLAPSVFRQLISQGGVGQLNVHVAFLHVQVLPEQSALQCDLLPHSISQGVLAHSKEHWQLTEQLHLLPIWQVSSQQVLPPQPKSQTSLQSALLLLLEVVAAPPPPVSPVVLVVVPLFEVVELIVD